MHDFLVEKWDLQYVNYTTKLIILLTQITYRGHKLILHDRPPHHFHRSSAQEMHDVSNSLSFHSLSFIYCYFSSFEDCSPPLRQKNHCTDFSQSPLLRILPPLHTLLDQRVPHHLHSTLQTKILLLTARKPPHQNPHPYQPLPRHILRWAFPPNDLTDLPF